MTGADEDPQARDDRLQVSPELLEFLGSRGSCDEVLDGAVVTIPPPAFFHEDLVAEVFSHLRVAAPVDLAVLGSHFGFR